MPDYGDKRGFQGSGRGGNPGNAGAGFGSNDRGTPYSQSLGEAIARANARNAPNPVDQLTQSIVQERGGFVNNSVSPMDLASMAGLMAQNPNFSSQGSMDALNNALDRSPGGLERRSVLGSYNLGMGVNPTTGMGLMDSLKYNTIDNPEFSKMLNPMNLLGMATGVPLAGAMIQGLIDRQKKQDKNIKLAKLEG